MSARWPEVPLTEVADLIRGVSYPKSDSRSDPGAGYVPVLRATNIQDARLVLEGDLVYVAASNVSSHQRLRPGDIVIATSSGSKHLVGKSALLRSAWDGSFGAFCAGIRPKANIEPRYLAYFLQSPRYWKDIGKKALGVNINNLRRGDLETLLLPLPSVAEQRELVDEVEKQFSRLDEAVANLKRVKANVLNYRAAVLSAAVAGGVLPRVAEPVEGRQISDAASQSLPSGWKLAVVADLCEAIVDCPHSTARFQPEGLPCIDTTWMSPEGLVDDRARYVDLSTYTQRTSRLVPTAGDIVFAREGTIGTAIIIPQGMQPCLGQRVMLLRVNTGASNRYLVHALHSEGVRAQYRDKALGSTVAHINVRDVKRLVIPLPPIAEQHRIAGEVDRRLSIVREVETEVDANLRRAETLRRQILSKAFVAPRGEGARLTNEGARRHVSA